MSNWNSSLYPVISKSISIGFGWDSDEYGNRGSAILGMHRTVDTIYGENFQKIF